MKKTPNGTAFDGKAVKLPNASRLGFDLIEARPGNLIEYTNPIGHILIKHAIVIGRIAQGTQEGSLVVLGINFINGSAYERWVDPGDVMVCREIPIHFLNWLASLNKDECRKNGEVMLQMAAAGEISNRYITDTWRQRWKHATKEQTVQP
jgi:hypothetical protein